jgi:hypothetical protein
MDSDTGRIAGSHQESSRKLHDQMLFESIDELRERGLIDAMNHLTPAGCAYFAVSYGEVFPIHA